MGDAGTYIVTGGGGYAGLRLGRALAKKGYNVRLFDVRPPPGEEKLPDNITFMEGDIRDREQVEKVFAGADCVYHLASYGMSGREQLNRKLIEEVNVKGTENVIQACRKCCIERLIYTSTYNVVFGGQTIVNGNEEKCKEYFPPEKHCDYYSATKTLAEQRVLAANGTALQRRDAVLRTCALRLAGVYGPAEQRHLPRIVGYIEAGLFSMVYGAADSLVDFLHVDNLVQAHVKVANKLTQENHIAAGQAYFICDNKPVNNFEFFRPLVEGLGYKFPTMRLPVTLVFYIAFLTEMLHFIVGRIYNFQPLLTRAEVYKTGVTHYFSTEKAQRDFGYKPTVQNDLTEVVKWFRENGHGRPHAAKSSSSGFLRMFVNMFMMFLFASTLMSFLPSVK